MTLYYVDSSVLVKRHVREQGSIWVRDLLSLSSGNLIITARISLTEVYSALNRLVRENRLLLQEYTQVQQDCAAVFATEYQSIGLSLTIENRARVLLEAYPLRAYDAVQLASALVARDEFIAQGILPMHFLSADNRLLDAARGKGMSVDNPNDHF